MAIHAESVGELARVLGRVPVEMAAGLRAELPVIGQELLRASQANAAWSGRIPDAHYMRVGTGSATGGVTVGVDQTKAPHARPYEGMSSGGSRGFFRHPTYGHDPWVQQATRPFLRPAIEHERPRMQEAIRALIRKVTSL